MHFPHPPPHTWVCCLWALSRSLPRLSYVFSCWGPECLLFLSCSWACVSGSAFQSPALFLQQHLPGFTLPVLQQHLPGFTLPVPPSLPLSLFRGREAGESRMPLVPLSLPTPPRAPDRLRLHEMYPPTTLESLGGVRLLRGSLLRRSFPAPLPSSAAGRRQRPVLGTFEPVVGSHLAPAFILSLPSGASTRIVTQPLGPRLSSQTPATLAATVAVAPRPRDVLLSPEIGSLGF